MTKRRKKRRVIGEVASQASQGAEWLGQLTEGPFRDEIFHRQSLRLVLKHLAILRSPLPRKAPHSQSFSFELIHIRTEDDYRWLNVLND